ncbi:ABC transporter [Kitasatospora sp. NPDC085895]|uniref:ABC transporter n=1 Tax=Kitasatospora sp. NPDC085895 TaxID=3155057 RepID=UPI00344C8D48
MTALIRYQLELLLRSHRLMPPALCYGVLMVLGLSGGDDPLGGHAWSAGLLLPVTAWLVRCAVTAEPAAARACRVAAADARRVHRADLLAALLVAAVLAAAGAAAVIATGGRSAAGPGPALLGGLAATAVCVLLGLAVGALCNRPVTSSGPFGILAALGAAVLVLMVPFAPAHVVVRALVRAAEHGELDLTGSVLPALLAAAVFAAGAVAVAAELAVRRGE